MLAPHITKPDALEKCMLNIKNR